VSTENVAIVERSLGHYLRRDYDAALVAFSDDVVLVTELERYQGHEGVVEEATGWEETWDAYRFEVEELVDADDKVVLLYRQFGRGRGSGVDVEECAGWVYTLRAGKIVRVEMHSDQATALRAAGVKR
jgi:ketosteroid isomerase-like protein